MNLSAYASTQDFFIKSFEESRRGNSKLTIESYAKKIGLGTSSLKMILSGKRKPTIHQILSLGRAHRLPPMQISYLETMALKEMAQSNWEKAYYSRLLKIKNKEIKLETMQASQEDLLADTMVLPLLVDLMESAAEEIDEKKLAKRFNTKEAYIKKLVEKFEQKKIIQPTKDGKFHIAFDKINHRHLQKKYIKDNLAEAARRVETEYDNPTTLFTTYTFSANEETLLRLQMDLKNLMEKYMAEDLSSSIQTREIAQACFQVFCVTKS